MLSSLVALSLLSCVSVPDIPACTNLGSKGYCIWTISNKEQLVDDKQLLNGKTWAQVERQSVILPIESWAKVKSFIENTCHQSNQCGSVGAWQKKLNSLDSQMPK